MKLCRLGRFHQNVPTSVTFQRYIIQWRMNNEHTHGIRPQRWSMVDVFCGHHWLQRFANGFDTIGPTPTDFFEGPTIAFNSINCEYLGWVFDFLKIWWTDVTNKNNKKQKDLSNNKYRKNITNK